MKISNSTFKIFTIDFYEARFLKFKNIVQIQEIIITVTQ